MMAEHCIYLLDWTKAGGRMYVGKTNDLKRRLPALRRSRNAVGAAFRKRGDPEVVILHRCELRAEVFVLEAYEIHHRGTLAPGGYNIKGGAEGRTVEQVEAWIYCPGFLEGFSPAALKAWRWFVRGSDAKVSGNRS